MRAKVDANQKDFVKALRKAGLSVVHLHTVGKGCPDIAVGYGFTTLLVEIKDPDKSPSQRKLTEDEFKFFNTFKGAAIVALYPEDVMKWFGVL